MTEKLVTPTALVLQALDLVRGRSLKREEIDWSELGRRIRDEAEECRSLDEAHALIRSLLLQLEDGHSFLRTSADAERRAEERTVGFRLHQEQPLIIDVLPASPAERKGLSPGDRIVRVDGEAVRAGNWRSLRRKALRSGRLLQVEQPTGVRTVGLSGGGAGMKPKPAGRIARPGVAYVDLPGHDGNGDLGEGQRYGEILAGFLYRLAQAGAKAWIIDLRRCDGGNMWPLLQGLVPLLGTGSYGSFVDPVDDVWYDWGFDGEALTVVNRADPAETYKMSDVPEPEALRSPDAPVALLTSAVTSSSGEAVLISFLGRNRTKTFGLPTGGLTTSNNLHVLLDGSWLLLAETIEADRNGRIYSGPIPPDERIEIDWRLLGTDDDPVIEAAASWLSSLETT